MENKIRNNSIDIFRYFCALLIVIIHVHPFLDFGEKANAVSIDYFTRIGVPFFFVVSGYFYSKGLHAGKKLYGGYVKKLFLIYTFWSVFYGIFYVINSLKKAVPVKTVADYLIRGFLYRGISEHLWFVPSLIVAVTVLTLAHRFGLEKLLYALSAVLFLVACFGFTYRLLIGNKIPVLNLLYSSKNFTVFHRMCCFGISFVTLGNFIYRNEKALTKQKSSFHITVCIIVYALFVCEKLAAAHFEFGTNYLYNIALYPLVLVIFLALLKNPMPSASKYAVYCRNAASFMYFSHPWFMKQFLLLFNLHTVVYILVIITCSIISFGITKLNNRYLNFLNA